MLLKEKIRELLPNRTRPIELNVTSGTGVEKFLNGMKHGGVFDDYNTHIDVRYYTQIDSELKKANGDTSLSRILHKVKYIAEFSEHNFKLLEKQINNPSLLNDLDKMWNSRDYDTLESYLDIWFDKKSPIYLLNVLNSTIQGILQKYANDPVSYEPWRYEDRTRFGTYLISDIKNKDTYELLVKEFAIDYFAKKGFGLVRLNARALKDEGYSGKSDLNRYVNSQIDQVNDIEKYPNGIVVLAPGWAYAARSMTTTKLDIGLNARNSTNSQDNDRVMSGTNKGTICTLDGKERLCGVQVQSNFVTESDLTFCEYTQQTIRELQTEQLKANPNLDPAGPWIRGINIFRHLAGAGMPTLTTESIIKDIITNSDRTYRECVNSLSLTSKNFWNPEILSILEKLIINSKSSSPKKLFTKVKKRIVQPNTKSKQSKKELTQEENLKQLIAYIMQVLIGAISLIKGVGAKENLFTLRECLEHIQHSEELNSSLVKSLGISAEDYIKLIDTNELPSLSMDHLLQGFIQDLKQ